MSNMTFETFDKDKHTLEVGTKIRLGGREGAIEDVHPSYAITVKWSDGNKDVFYTLERFPGLEIEDTSLPPLKIDKRVKEDLIRLSKKYGHPDSDIQAVVAYLNSLEET